jgi:CheY-like chemotaxis protein
MFITTARNFRLTPGISRPVPASLTFERGCKAFMELRSASRCRTKIPRALKSQCPCRFGKADSGSETTSTEYPHSIVDDEPLARTNLRVLLLRHPHIEIVGEPESGLEALEAIRKTKPHLVFLDVQMPEFDGFDVLEILGGDAPPAVIFVTAYDQYALRAFEAGALDYLLKPFDDDRFERALPRGGQDPESQADTPNRRTHHRKE